MNLKTKTLLNNIMFFFLPKWAKRTIIVKDALKHLHSNKISPKVSVVMNIPGDFFYETKQLQTLLANTNESCDVCQRGALLYSYVMRINKFEVRSNRIMGTAGENTDSDILLRKLFSLYQLMLIERAFEGRFHYHTLNHEDITNCDTFVAKYYDDSDRMEAILLNMVHNWGTFKPEQG